MKRSSTRTALSLALLTSTVAILTTTAHAQLPQPQLDSVWPTGAQAGQSFELAITGGDDLDGVDQLLFTHPGIKAERVMRGPDKFFPQAVPVDRKFKVTVAGDVPPGSYEVRAVGLYGVTNARMFVVSKATESQEIEPNNTLDEAKPIELNTVVNGRCDNRGFDHFSFDLKKDQRVIIRCDAQRIDSRASILLTLLDASGRQLARETSPRRVDPVIDFVAPADGKYVVRISDLTYEGGDAYVYRLTVGNTPWIDFVDPPVIRAGQQQQVTVYGRNLPGGQPAPEIKVDGHPVEKLVVTIGAPSDPAATTPPIDTMMRVADAEADFISYHIANEHGVSNSVRLAVTSEPMIAEAEPNDEIEKPQKLTLPCEYVGRFFPRRDMDCVSFDAKKGQKLWIEVFSNRLGVPTDPSLVIYRVIPAKDGPPEIKEITQIDDQAYELDDKRYHFGTSDPGQVFDVPEDGEYRVMVQDLFGSAQGDPRYFYRLMIREARPDFRLVAMPVKTISKNQNGADPWTTSICRGGTERIRLLPLRREGFDTTIEVTAEGLPEGVEARPVEIGSWSQLSYMVLYAKPDAKPWSGTIRLVAKAKVDGKELVRTARGAEILWGTKDNNTTAETRVVGSLAVAVLDDDATKIPIAAQLGAEPGKVYRMARGGKLKIPAKLIKQKDDFKGEITLKETGIDKQNDRYIKVKDLKIKADKPEDEVEIDIDMKAPMGLFSMTMVGDVEIEYERNAVGLKAAQDEQKRLEELAKNLAEASKKSSEEKQKAEQALQQARNEMKQAEDRKAKTKPEEAEAAQKAFDEATKKVQAAEAAAKQAADAEQAAKDDAKRAEDLKREATEYAKNVANTAKKAKVKAEVAAAVVPIEIVEYAVTLDAKPSADKTTAGGSIVVDAKATKEFDFDDVITFELKAPNGVGGVKISDAEALKQSTLAQAEAEKAKAAHQQATQDAQQKQQQMQQATQKANELKQALANAEKESNDKAEAVKKIGDDKPDEKKAAEEAAKAAADKVTAARAAFDEGEKARQAAEQAAKAANDAVNAAKQAMDNAVKNAAELAKKVNEPVKIDKGAAETKIAIDTSPNTPPGTHTFTLVSKYKFNNQNITMEQPITLTIDAPPAEKKG